MFKRSHLVVFSIPKAAIRRTVFFRSLMFSGLFSLLLFCKLNSYGQSCGIVEINTTAFNLGGSTWRASTSGTYNISSGPLGMYIDFYTLDNSFSISVNGMQIANTEINFELASNQPSTVFAYFNDGSYYGNGTIPQIYSTAGSKLQPLIRVKIDPSGNVTMFGAKSIGAALEPMKLQAGTFNNVGGLNTATTNLVTITQSSQGPTLATGAVYGIVEVQQPTADPTRTICAGTSISLTATSEYGVWNVDPTSLGINLSLTNVSPGVASATFNASAKGLYKFIYTVGSCIITDTVNIREAVIPTFALTQYPKTVCTDSIVTITIDSIVNLGTSPIYNWYVNNIVQQNVSANSFTYSAKKGDIVSCEITSNTQCILSQKATDSLKIVFNTSSVTLADTMKICPGDSTVLTVSPGFTNYLWKPTNQTSASIAVSQTGLYTVTAKDPQGCPSTASVIVTNHTIPSNILAFNDTTICSLGTATIFTKKPYSEYLWSTGSTDSVLQTQKEGLYYLQVKDSNGCVGSDSAYVTHTMCSEFLYFPNAFTPNADALNDIFKPTFYGVIHSYELNIYDRWGKLIFASRNPLLGWDGRMKGNMLTPGTYVWYCRFKANDFPESTVKGTVLLLR
jgi:gliding motility-associated-like protein